MKKYLFGIVIGIMVSSTALASVVVGSSFLDVSGNAYYADAINQMANWRVVKGYENGNFGPNDPVTRGQLAAILSRYNEALLSRHSSDNNVGILMDVVCNNVKLGDQDGTLPNDYASLCKARAESDHAIIDPDISKNCYKVYKESNVSFEYPCDWKTNVTGGKTMSSVGTVVSPDGKASFDYPAGDYDLPEVLIKKSFINVNGQQYAANTYELNGETITNIQMGKAINQNGYNLEISYEDVGYKDDLERILSTFKF